MKTLSFGTWWLRIATFLLAALAAASATYWVLKWTAAAAPVSIVAPTASGPTQTDPQLVARLLGGGQVATVAALVDRSASRFKLTGVVASGAKGGYALIAADGQPARPYRVGTAISDNLVLQSVATRSAALAPSIDGPPAFTLELPTLARSDGKTAGKSDSATEAKSESKVEGASGGTVGRAPRNRRIKVGSE
jgi:general secretion pathway protein C